MTDRRSGRTRKVVDYSKFSGGDSDNDDDFRDSSSQSTKRKKNESSPPKAVKVKVTKIDVDSLKKEEKKSEKQLKEDGESILKKRPSLSDKVFERHLSEALEISKQDTEPVSSENVMKELKEKKSEDEWSGASSSESEEENGESDWSDDEGIEVKKSSARTKNSTAYQEEDKSDCSDDDGQKKSKKLVIKKGEPKHQSKKLLSPQMSQPSKSVTPKSRRPLKNSPGSCVASPGLKPGVKTTGTPCQVISHPVGLPTKGLRLGLSRKVPGKPLHSVIKVQH